MKHLGKKIMVLIAMTLMLVACVPSNKNVVVTNYPVEFLVKTLAGDRVNVKRLDAGKSPQSSVITPEYTEVLKNADVVFHINELEPYWEIYNDLLEANDDKIEIFDLADRSSLYNFKRYVQVNVNSDTHVVEQPYYEGGNYAQVDKYEKDPYLWMDPLAMTSMARSIKDWLVAQYPDDTKKFEDRFAKLEIELTSLQAEYQKLRKVTNPIKFVSINATYGNWQKSFNVGVYPIGVSKYGVLPDEALLTDMRTRIQADGVKYIVLEDDFTEAQLNLYNKLKTELKLTEVKLSNLYTLSDQDIEAQNNYVLKMYDNLETLESMSR